MVEINIHTSHGLSGSVGFVTDIHGNIVRVSVNEDWDAPKPSRFDVQEHVAFYACPLPPTDIDILDIGFWNPDGSYIPPEDDYRR